MNTGPENQAQQNFRLLHVNRRNYSEQVLSDFDDLLAEAMFKQLVVKHGCDPKKFSISLEQDPESKKCILHMESDEPATRKLLANVNSNINVVDKINGIVPVQVRTKNNSVEYRTDSLLKLVKCVNHWVDPEFAIGNDILLPLEISEVGRTSRL